ncbi:cell envelope integrity protein CreD [Erythrobacter insulae]|uniref:Cell envelope integrity protein CreD n=1 Tax=Erythrobacter insulae TaxID=2584124 RepID=A0A547PE92_9SPHN|nr:cell envelope integrity protein CreD [Erythrobacter insulae]TRD12471.1 cell envelope integrity protein CreD [Erythrobacter insulae]
MSDERSPGVKLLFTGLVGAALIVPLLMVYWLISDRQHQARVAQASITEGWAGAQTVSGPMLIVPYTATREISEERDGKTTTRTVTVREMLYLSPIKQNLDANIDPEIRSRGIIHQSVVYDAAITGSAGFAMPADLDRLGIQQTQLLLDEAFLQLPISDPRGLQTDAALKVGDQTLNLKPGLGSSQTGAGVHAFFDWTEGAEFMLQFSYTLRGSSAFSMVPRGEETNFAVRSTWPHPSFSGGFLPGDADKEVGPEGFSAKWSISNLALGQSLVSTNAPANPVIVQDGDDYRYAQTASGENISGNEIATIRLMEPVDLYKRVERALKYGFLFIGFTFLAFLMFDIVAGARVAPAEYLLTGAGLILFFVMLLAFAELIGFAFAYIVASGAIIGLLTSYSAAVLGSWKRARVIGALLIGLYAVLYVLLNLEAWSLVIGSVMLFAALAGVMYATRTIEWSNATIRGASANEAAL